MTKSECDSSGCPTATVGRCSWKATPNDSWKATATRFVSDKLQLEDLCQKSLQLEDHSKLQLEGHSKLQVPSAETLRLSQRYCRCCKDFFALSMFPRARGKHRHVCRRHTLQRQVAGVAGHEKDHMKTFSLGKRFLFY